MLSLLAILALGFLLGVRHAGDADHVVAVATIVSKEKKIRSALRVGAMWGLGHTLTILLVGGAIILFKITISAKLGLSMELAVAVMLILLGILNILGIPKHVENDTRAYPMKPLLVGLVHGLAGSAAVALLVLTAIPAPKWAAAYLLIFGTGTIVGMMGATLAMATPMHYAAARFKTIAPYLRFASGALSVGFGVFLFHQVGFVDGLFTGHMAWNPH